MDANQLRDKFLAFFAEKGHQIEPSASLVPNDDPSLLWINSGVATLKQYFDGRLVPSNPRIVNAQKSIRTNDIENVGYTSRHHTFFEMLGNFSIGDYFKIEAIDWAWEFLTDPRWLNLDPLRLSVTVHPDDDDAYRHWHDQVGIPADRIVKLEGNFWDIGEGPSGPNTEIFYDRGASFGDASDPECYPGGENERYLEIWNLVFSQFNHNPDGTYTPLPKKNIDTGMGLERMLSILQDVPSNYDTTLFQPMIQETCRRAGVTYGARKETDIALQVIADHVRTIVFAIGDGVLPSNEGRGYVLRRLLRRAIRYGFKLGIEDPFLYQYTVVVADVMKHFYPELEQKRELIERVIRDEEERFLSTLTDGLRILEEITQKALNENQKEISGAVAFKMYDTYGFPLELTEEYVLEHHLQVNRKEFEYEMEKQRSRSRSSRTDVSSMKTQGGVLGESDIQSQFIGYDGMESTSVVKGMIVDDHWADRLNVGQKGLVLLDQTPFYAESGGQVADRGWITTDTGRMKVEHVWKGPKGEPVHDVIIEEGSVQQGQKAHLVVDPALRSDTTKNHTATHLLHQALKEVLGEHVNQAGSLVAPHSLRFDFSHRGGLTSEETKEIENRVNAQIWKNLRVVTSEKSVAEAKAMGARALFGEKYGEVVRVVQIGDYSLELCGGIHVKETAELGLFKITSEYGIGSGVRRVEAITGKYAFDYLDDQARCLNEVAMELKCSPQEVQNRLGVLKDRLGELIKENEALQSQVNRNNAGQFSSQLQDVEGVPLLSVQVDSCTMENLRNMMDEVRLTIPEGVIVLGSVADHKVNLVVTVSPAYISQGLHAGKIVKEIAQLCDGGGGGRPDMAQAGGKNPDKLPKALQKVEELIRNMYNGI